MILKLQGHAREIAGDELKLNYIKTTVRDIINDIGIKHNGFKEEIEQNEYLVLKNGVNIKELNGYDTIIKNTDVVHILPKIMGG
ncbi:MAG: MoaD/ThiS family protein [Candidatus Aenigmarchaeota archaeon]|nr:MoaD/ThiS family protein [Candidatus Aenigmarchaeota archaeon]